MRIPVNSCEGCNKDAEITLSGAHPMGNGNWIRCAFVSAELGGLNPPVNLISVHRKRSSAVRAANKNNAGLLWVGQSPVEMWLVVK